MSLAQHLEIVGAGPAGIAAAITARAAGRSVTIYEKRPHVGARFHGDFQGLENWTADEDVLEELDRLGLPLGGIAAPVREMICFDARGAGRKLRSPGRPIFYLVSRGPMEGTLDAHLARQALQAGVTLRYSTRQDHLDAGGVVAEGPHAADIIAVGYTFRTDMSDGCFGVLSDALAPAGYAYLLVHQGRGTLATCLFQDFHDERVLLQRTVDFFTQHVGLRWEEPTPFGGSGNISLETKLHARSLLYAGESAGLQDALFGFGLRYAMLSGHFAARAWLSGSAEVYERLWRRRLLGFARAGIADRRIYWLLGDRGRRLVMRHWLDQGDQIGRAHV